MTAAAMSKLRQSDPLNHLGVVICGWRSSWAGAGRPAASCGP